MKEAMEVGALAFLTKPIEIAELCAAIDGFMLEGIK
jgi:DNA-binding response OmpR family regulator